MTVRVLYHQEPDGWWAESLDIDGWTVAGETFEQLRALVEDGVRFALASAADERGEDFDEDRFAGVTVEHSVPAPAWLVHESLGGSGPREGHSCGVDSSLVGRFCFCCSKQ